MSPRRVARPAMLPFTRSLTIPFNPSFPAFSCVLVRSLHKCLLLWWPPMNTSHACHGSSHLLWKVTFDQYDPDVCLNQTTQSCPPNRAHQWQCDCTNDRNETMLWLLASIFSESATPDATVAAIYATGRWTTPLTWTWTCSWSGNGWFSKSWWRQSKVAYAVLCSHGDLPEHVTGRPATPSPAFTTPAPATYIILLYSIGHSCSDNLAWSSVMFSWTVPHKIIQRFLKKMLSWTDSLA